MIQGYAEYKDSGVDWLGEIPAGWEKQQVKRHFAIGRGRVISKEELDENGSFPVYSSQTKNNGILGLISTFDFDTPQITWTTDGANAGTVFLRIGKYNCTNVCGTLKPTTDQTNLSFCAYTIGVAALFYKRPDTNGAKIMNEEMAVIEFPFPPLPEQTAIANFLDDKTARIDELVEIKRRQIALLAERKQILIQNAVTKGLNPNARMKNSGVDWIGEIPVGWEVRRLASFGRFSKGGGFSKSDLSEEGKDAVLYGDIYTQYNFIIDKSVRKISTKAANNSIQIKQNDLLFTGSGETKEDIGKCVVYRSSDSAVAGGDIILFRQTGHDHLFLSFCLNTHGIVEEKAKSSKGEIIVHTYASNLRGLFIPIPPSDEQESIALHIQDEIKKIDDAIAIKQNQVTKLNEYKTTLINAAVTGKIKVT